MYCDNKLLKENGGQSDSQIAEVRIKASVYGTTITFLSGDVDMRLNIRRSLEQASIPVQNGNPSIGVSVETPLHNTANILKAINQLNTDGLISRTFADQIITNYPNGHGGTMNLNGGNNVATMLLLGAAAHLYAAEKSYSNNLPQLPDAMENGSYSGNTQIEFVP